MTFSGILYSSVIILHSPSLSLNANWSLSKQPVKSKIGLLKKFIRNWSTLFNSHRSQKTSKTCTDMTRSQRGRIHAHSRPLFEESPLERRVRVPRREKSYNVYAVNYVNVWTDWFCCCSRLSGKLRFIFVCFGIYVPLLELYGIDRYSKVMLI